MAFRRALGTFDATMLVVGGIIGAGIFVNPYLVAQRLPSAGPILWVWIAGGAIALAGALAFAELASIYPKAGGEYAYLREAYHPLVAFLFGWASFLMIQGGGIAAVSIAFAEHTLRFAGSPRANPTPLAIAAILAMALVNVLGVKPGSRVLNGLVVIKILSLAALILGGLWLAPRLPPLPPIANAERPPATILAFGAALVPILFSYGGWQNANTVAEEMRSPEKALPRALTAGMTAGSSPSQSIVTRQRAPAGTRSTATPIPARSTSAAVTIDEPHARASATSPARALPMPRRPTWTIRSTQGISDARRIGLLHPNRSPRTSSRQSRCASTWTTVSGPRPANAWKKGMTTESSPPSTTGTAPASRNRAIAAVMRCLVPGGSEGSPTRSPQSTTPDGRRPSMSKS